MSHRRLLPLPALLVAISLALTGCGGSSSKTEKKEATPSSVMASAKKKFDDASSVHIALSTKSTPSEGNGVLGATGDITHDPAFAGDVKVVLGGLTATVPITSVGGKVYAKLPLQTKYSVIKPDEYGAPDPADFADPDKGLSALLTELKSLKKGDRTRDGDEILTTYTGTLAGSAVKKIIPSADTGSTYDTKVGIDESGHATKVSITGPFFADSKDVTYSVTFSQYDKGVKIDAPSS
jgi:lipoprotein LprG